MEIDVVLWVGGDFGDLGEEELSLLEDICKHGYVLLFLLRFLFQVLLCFNNKLLRILLFQHI